MIGDAGAFDRCTLGRVPALRLDEAGQRVRLELQARFFRQADAPWHHTVAEQAAPAVEQHQHGALVDGKDRLVPGGRLGVRGQLEPVEAVGREGQQIRQVADRRERGPPQHFDGNPALERSQIEFHRLRRARQVGHAQDRVIAVFAQVGQDLAIPGPEEAARSATEGLAGLAHGQQAFGPAQKRTGIA